MVVINLNTCELFIFSPSIDYFWLLCRSLVLSKFVRILQGEWPSGLYNLRQVTEVKFGRVRSDFGWVTTEA